MTPPEHLLLAVARSVERVDSTAPSTDDVNAVIALDALARAIVEHNRCLLVGEPVDWAALTGRLHDAERACRRPRSSESAAGTRTVAGGARSRAAVTRRPTDRPDTSPIYGGVLKPPSSEGPASVVTFGT